MNRWYTLFALQEDLLASSRRFTSTSFYFEIHYMNSMLYQQMFRTPEEVAAKASRRRKITGCFYSNSSYITSS